MRPNYIPRQTYLGDGATSQFTFPFKIVNKNHLLVLMVANVSGVVTWQTRGDDTTYFTTTLNADGSGRINMLAAPAIGTRIILLLADDAPTQPSRYTIDDRYDLKKFESSLDTLSGQIQRIRYLVDRSFKLPESFTAAFPSSLGAIENNSVLVFEQDLDTLEWNILTVPRADFIGPEGPIGLSPEIQVNPVTVDVDYEDDSTVEIDNTDALNPILTFTLRAGPKGDAGDGVELIHVEDYLPVDGEGVDNDVWIVINPVLPEHGNFYQRLAGVYTLKGNIQGPPGGVNSLDTEQGDLLFSWVGYSANYNQAVNLPTLRDAVDFVIGLAYLIPLINSFTSNNTLREKGATVTNPTLTVNAAKRTDDLATVRFYDQSTSTLLATQAASNPAAISQSLVTALSFTDNKTFRVEVDDTHMPVGTAQQTLNFPFVYPYYAVTGPAAMTGAAIRAASLTGTGPEIAEKKKIINSNNNVEHDFIAPADGYLYFAQPMSYPALTLIQDASNFDVTNSFTVRTNVAIVGLDGTSQNYRVYEFNNLLPAGTYPDFKFKR